MNASIGAYDLPERIASYDADMDVMHPNRHLMLESALRILPFNSNQPLTILDLGVGTGFFSLRFLKEFWNAHIIAVDGAASMLDVARARLGDLKNRVDFRLGDFRFLDQLLKEGERLDLVITAYALHHLNKVEKQTVVNDLVTRLRPGGWLVNADLITSPHPLLEERFQQIRAHGCVLRAKHGDSRFSDEACTRSFLRDMEKAEGDQPLTLREDLAILEASDLKVADVFWLETREAVTGGVK